ncbi:hypothetical protein FB45DRAFT_1004782 [Roridomyces roridus]|uniref:Uncharacterized protein n=1 Tax=Roridomyces roridus TaxID=1738132 RepID=A0AAD7FJH1_9AGAR|nr:hypothetical protein FB45DRAFT_1004782 [Roridomyces roridus]
MSISSVLILLDADPQAPLRSTRVYYKTYPNDSRFIKPTRYLDEAPAVRYIEHNDGGTVITLRHYEQKTSSTRVKLHGSAGKVHELTELLCTSTALVPSPTTRDHDKINILRLEHLIPGPIMDSGVINRDAGFGTAGGRALAAFLTQRIYNRVRWISNFRLPPIDMENFKLGDLERPGQDTEIQLGDNGKVVERLRKGTELRMRSAVMGNDAQSGFSEAISVALRTQARTTDAKTTFFDLFQIERFPFLIRKTRPNERYAAIPPRGSPVKHEPVPKNSSTRSRERGSRSKDTARGPVTCIQPKYLSKHLSPTAFSKTCLDYFSPVVRTALRNVRRCGRHPQASPNPTIEPHPRKPTWISSPDPGIGGRIQWEDNGPWRNRLPPDQVRGCPQAVSKKKSDSQSLPSNPDDLQGQPGLGRATPREMMGEEILSQLSLAFLGRLQPREDA